MPLQPRDTAVILIKATENGYSFEVAQWYTQNGALEQLDTLISDMNVQGRPVDFGQSEIAADKATLKTRLGLWVDNKLADPGAANPDHTS